jgi:hypothetical protein
LRTDTRLAESTASTPRRCRALRRENIHLHFFGMPDVDPEKSYGSCLAQVPDTGGRRPAFSMGYWCGKAIRQPLMTHSVTNKFTFRSE